jgi:hypothetical protein
MGQILTLAIPFNTPDQRKNYTALVGRSPDLGAWVEALVDPKTRDAAFDRLWDKAFRDRWKVVAASYPHLSRWLETRVPGLGQLLRAPEPSPVAAWDFGSAPAGGDIRFASDQKSSDLGTIIDTHQPPGTYNKPPMTLVIDTVLWAFGSIGATESVYDSCWGRELLLVFTPTGKIRLKGDVYLYCPIVAGPWQIFEPVNGGRICFARGGGQANASRVFPQWWGARPDAQPSVNREAIQAAINSLDRCGTVFLLNGSYTIDGPLYLQDRIRLEGEQQECAEIRLLGQGSCIVDDVFAAPPLPVWTRDHPGSPTLQNLTLRGTPDKKLPPQDEDVTPTHCGLRMGGRAVDCRNVTIEGFTAAVLSRPKSLDDPNVRYKVAHDLPTEDPTYLAYGSFVNLTIRDARWGLRFEGGANYLCIRGIHFQGVDTAVFLAVQRLANGSTWVQPPSVVDIRDLSCDAVGVGVRSKAADGVYSLLVDGCHLDVSVAGVVALPSHVGTGAFIGFCERTTADGTTIGPVSAIELEPGKTHPFVSAMHRGGTAGTSPPTSAGWHTGDRVANDFSTGEAKPGDPFGWACGGTAPKT